MQTEPLLHYSFLRYTGNGLNITSTGDSLNGFATNNPSNDSETRASHSVDRQKHKSGGGCANVSDLFVQQCGSKFIDHLDKREGGVTHMFRQYIRSMQ